MSKLLILLILVIGVPQDNFKSNQLRYKRVRDSYTQKLDVVKANFSQKDLDLEKSDIFIRAYKADKSIELWAKKKDNQQYTLITTYKICTLSGKIGPKRKQFDLQVPEGFYFIDRFNPASNFYLSLGINYPNNSDKILGAKNNLGGDIFIHGNCVTIGCLPITDDKIKELYVTCVEAKNGGQDIIPVYIFPGKLNADFYKNLLESTKYNENTKMLWRALKKEDDYFNKNKQKAQVRFLTNGDHYIEFQ